jgi:hypothetical protein
MSVDRYPHEQDLQEFPVYLLTLAGDRGLGVVALSAARVALANACGLASKSTKIIKLGSSDATSFDEIDVVDDRCVQWKDSFDPDAETRLPHRNGFARAAMFPRDHDAFKSLQSLFGLRFFNPHVNTDRIAWLKLWNVITQLAFFNVVQSIHFAMLL